MDATIHWALAEPFWGGVVHSPGKVRKHWDTMRAQMARRPAREQDDERPDRYADQDRRERERLERWLASLGVDPREWDERSARRSPEDVAWRDDLLARTAP